MKGTVRVVILTTTSFDLLMPSDNIISVLWASSYKTWNIFSHCPRVYDNSKRPSNVLTLDAVAPLKTGWKKSKNRRWGDEVSITTHSPYFPPGISFPGHLVRVCDTVLHSSTNDMHNLALPSTDPPHIPIPPTSINIIWIRGTVCFTLYTLNNWRVN